MKKVLDFLNEVIANNNREWFEAHRSDYLEATACYTQFIEDLIQGISRFDPSVSGLKPKDCMFRFYRDIRFSPNKMPYKNHFGAYICQQGRKSPFSGYYFHVEPKGSGYLNGHLLASGLYNPQPKVLKSVREEIMLNGASFEAAAKESIGFVLEDSQALKKVPKGFPTDSPWAEYLKLKNPCMYKSFDDNELLSKDLLEHTLEAFKHTKNFNDWLNKAVEYALD
ncbi:MAG TPA: DUF2461 domain-containing protein [Bacteroidales bacterium]|nr:DUF2461 domain-containing protein [Bacteroidales bacterium]